MLQTFLWEAPEWRQLAVKRRPHNELAYDSHQAAASPPLGDRAAIPELYFCPLRSPNLVLSTPDFDTVGAPKPDNIHVRHYSCDTIKNAMEASFRSVRCWTRLEYFRGLGVTDKLVINLESPQMRILLPLATALVLLVNIPRNLVHLLPAKVATKAWPRAHPHKLFAIGTR